jgi:hypothetical protein
MSTHFKELDYERYSTPSVNSLEHNPTDSFSVRVYVWERQRYQKGEPVLSFIISIWIII